MRFGLLYTLESPRRWFREFADLYDAVLDQVTLAENLGYDSVFFSEHHDAEDGQLASPLVMASAVAGRTKRIRIGTSVAVLPFYHPVRLAEDLAVLDQVSHGRLIVGLGSGFLPEEFASYGIPIKQRPSRVNESLEIMTRAWMQEAFSYEGKYYQLKNVAIRPRPFQHPHPPLWFGAIRRPALERAVRWKIPVMLTLATYQGVKYTRERYLEILKEHGQDVPETQPLLRDVYVAESDEKAWEDTQPHVLHVYRDMNLKRGMVDSYEDGQFRFVQDKDDRLFDQGGWPIVKDRLIVGSPETCIREIGRYQEATGVTHLIMRMHMGGLDPAKTESSIRLFAQQVMPRFQEPTNIRGV